MMLQPNQDQTTAQKYLKSNKPSGGWGGSKAHCFEPDTQGGHEFWDTGKARPPLNNTAGLIGLSELEPKQGTVTVPNPEPSGNSPQSLDMLSLNHYRTSPGSSCVDKDLGIPEDGKLNTDQQRALAAVSPDHEQGCTKQEHIPQKQWRNDFPLIGTYDTTSGTRWSHFERLCIRKVQTNQGANTGEAPRWLGDGSTWHRWEAEGSRLLAWRREAEGVSSVTPSTSKGVLQKRLNQTSQGCPEKGQEATDPISPREINWMYQVLHHKKHWQSCSEMWKNLHPWKASDAQGRRPWATCLNSPSRGLD